MTGGDRNKKTTASENTVSQEGIEERCQETADQERRETCGQEATVQTEVKERIVQKVG